ncbi:MAG: glycosyltransferase family 2 protein [Deltaproteobacteria bacterium]|nr:glycosyltransferase family 2 protein [Deltaproteobacteria bacterium]
MKLSIVVPVYNEKDTIERILSRVIDANVYNMEKEIIVIDDFSTDGTREILKRYPGNTVKIYYHEQNKGKGAALKTGFAKVTGDAVIIQDADLEYDPQDYEKLLKPLLDGKADVVFGSRFMGGEPHRVIYFWHYLGNKFLSMFSNMFTNLNLTDMETCYKLFKKEVLDKISIEEDRFGFEPEITAKVSMLDVRIYEVGISYSGRSYAEGKKIGFKDGFRTIYVIVKYGLFKRRPA